MSCGKSLVLKIIKGVLFELLETLFPSTRYSRVEIYKHVVKNAGLATFKHFNAWYCGNYQFDSFKKLIWSAKYKNNTEAVKICIEILLDEIIALKSSRLSLFNNNCLLLAIPSTGHFIGERDTDYMQDIVRQLLSSLDGSILRTKPLDIIKIADHAKKRQSSASCRKERMYQAVNKFYVDTFLTEDIPVILIDDVITTGSTISDSVRALKKAGARHIHVISLAH